MIDLPPPTPTEVHDVAHFMFDVIADASDTQTIVGPINKVGKRSRYCFVRVAGTRFRLSVTIIPDFTGDDFPDYEARVKHMGEKK